MSDGAKSADGRSVSCRSRFTKMLRCVEKTGSSVACSPEVESFLACERAVFTAALKRQPNERSPHASNRQAVSAYRRPPGRHVLPSDRSSFDENKNASDNGDMDLHGLASAVFLTRLSQGATYIATEVKHAASMQLHACKRLKDTCAEHGFLAHLRDKCKSMVVEGTNSVVVVGGAVVRAVDRLSQNFRSTVPKNHDRDDEQRP